MRDDPKQGNWTKWIASLTTSLISLLLFYLLSLGPVHWLMCKGFISGEVELAYASPGLIGISCIYEAANRPQWFKHATHRYLSWWTPASPE